MTRSSRTSARARRTAVFTVLAALFLNVPIIAGSITPASASTTAPSDDSYVESARPDKTFGHRSSMKADASPTRVAYLKFDVQGIGTPESVALQVNVESSGDDLQLYAVADNTWDEGTLTYNNAPALGGLIDSTGNVSGGNAYYFDLSSHVTGDGVYSLAIATTDNTSIRIGSKEGGNAAQLHAPAPGTASPFLVTRSGTVYTSASQTTASSYTGTLKYVVESSVFELGIHGGGTITFDADTFDLGNDHFELDNVNNVLFEGQGMASTVIVNNSSDADDTEVFDIVHADGLTIRDMTISANGAPRSTSDALDFDDGNNITIERVSVTASRGRGIVFDGKGSGWTANGNTVADCFIDGIPGDGIELLGSSDNVISGCTITDVGGHGIQINKSSSSASQPNKKSSNNLISGNTVDDSGRDGININSSDDNRIIDNLVINNSDDVTNRDGIRLDSNSGVTCDDNEISGNTATDNQPIKTQRYGINISSANCNRTVVGANDLAGNKTGQINDNGADTQYDLPDDTTPPTVPSAVGAVALSHFEVNVTWVASTDNVGVDSYTVYRNGGVVGSVDGATASFVDATAAPHTTYDYTVEAFDAAENPSGESTPPATVTTPPPSATITVTPTDDAYVDSTQTTRNFGTSSSMRIDGSPEKDAYLKFDVTGITGTVSSATIRIYAASGSSVGFDVRQVADTSWIESSITYANAPTIGATLGSSGSFSSGTYLEIDVTGYVTGNGVVSFGITTPHTTAIRFDSSEGGNQPELVISQS